MSGKKKGLEKLTLNKTALLSLSSGRLIYLGQKY